MLCSFYASVITTCSIGYGDYSFPTQSGRALCVLYSLVAVVVCSRFVGGISAYIVNSKQDKLVQNVHCHLLASELQPSKSPPTPLRTGAETKASSR